MQAAFGFVCASPPAGSFMLALSYGLGAVSAPDTRIATVVERVIGQVIAHDVAPDVGSAPTDERIDFDQIPFCVPLDNLSSGAGGRLIAPDRSHPCIIPMQCNAEGLEFSEAAAKVRVAFPKTRTIEFMLLFRAQAGGNRADLDAVAVLETPVQVVGFGEQEAGIKEENIRSGVDCYGDINERDSFGAEAGGDRDSIPELVEGPFEDLARAGVFQHLRGAGNKSIILTGALQRLNLNQILLFKLDLRRHIKSSLKARSHQAQSLNDRLLEVGFVVIRLFSSQIQSGTVFEPLQDTSQLYRLADDGDNRCVEFHRAGCVIYK